MDGVLNTLTNPWVLGIGGALGVILLLSRSAGGGNDSGGAYYSEAFLSESQRTAAAVNQTAITASYDLEGKRLNADVTRAVAVMNTVRSLAETSAVLDANLAASHAGTVRALAASNAAVVIDRQQNFARLGMTYADGFTQRALSRDRVTVANIQAKAQKNANMWGGIAGITKAVGDVAKAAILA
jgi:hypothetical protein